MKLQDRIGLVTGAGSGIGRAIALLFAEEGARVVVNDLTLKAAQKTVDEMGSTRSRGHAVAADVADSTQVKAMFAELEQRYGTLDILVNNAGIAEGSDRWDELNRKGEVRLREMMTGQPIQTHWDFTQEMTDGQWHRMIGVHLDGTFFCTREALKLMSRPRADGSTRGVIVNMSSIAGLMGLEASAHYSAAKGGILSFTRALAQEVASRHIRVNAICPGGTDTPMIQPLSPLLKAASWARTPLARWATPKEVAATALFLASDDSSYYTGQWLSPNGGLFMG